MDLSSASTKEINWPVKFGPNKSLNQW
jgi:hypothetical protein